MREKGNKERERREIENRRGDEENDPYKEEMKMVALEIEV